MTRSVGIVIPVYNRRDTLLRTLASLEAVEVDDIDLTVVVADDGSDEDIESLVGSWDPSFTKRYVRQEHSGFGASRARNLGASVLDSEIVVFLDSDGLVPTNFVAGHLSHHEGPTPRIVIGRRADLQASEISLDDLRSGTARLAGSDSASGGDFRTVLARRTSGYSRTDEGYRAFVSSNVSLPLELHRATGGFDERFRWWGSEDSEFGWRLWQTGAEFIDARENVIFHQTDIDTAGGQEGRELARAMNRGLLTSLVPQRFYRKGMPQPTPEVSKVSVVVSDVPGGAAEDWWHDLERQTLPDFEVLFVADPTEHDPFAGAAEGERRISFAKDIGAAIAASSGEYVAFTVGHGAPNRTFIQNIVKRLDQRPAAAALSFGLEVPDQGTFGLAEDVGELEEGWSCLTPTNLVVRRRWLMQQLQAIGPAEVLDHARTNSMRTRQALIALPGVVRTERPDGFRFEGTRVRQVWDEARLGPSQAMRAGVRLVKERARPTATPTAVTMPRSSGRPHVRYVGWVGKDNLGDEAMLQAAVEILPWADVEARGEARNLLLLGGGTLINRTHYLGWVNERDSPRIERAVLGTGVASPEYWGTTEDPAEWKRWLATCAYVGVRGPASLATLESWGISEGVEVCGDLALALEPPETTPVEGSILIAPASTGGELWGKSDDAVYAALATAASQWVDAGRDVILLSCHPTDDRPIIQIKELMEGRPVQYVPGYLDTAESLARIAASSLVVGERLHACVLAATAGRPFLSIEYRPKVRDFAMSVGMEEFVIRTDAAEPGRIVELASALNQAPRTMIDSVAGYRLKLAAAASTIESALQV